MKLYMIRLQNGDSTILQAENEKDAIVAAGLSVDPENYTDIFRKQDEKYADPAEVLYILNHAGAGPQNFRIRELCNFYCRCNLKDEGTLELVLESEEATDEIDVDYPELKRAFDEMHADMYPDKESVDNYMALLLASSNDSDAEREFRNLKEREREYIARGVAKERARLTAF